MPSPKPARPRPVALAAPRAPIATAAAEPRLIRTGDVIFSLTVTQASALLALKLGGRVRAESLADRLKIIVALEGKRLVRRLEGDEVKLTRAGECAAELCALLAMNGRADG